ncbi:2-keto-4-pentenoate hydratase [Streptomyces sp. NPDC058295]|uniref:2-keto-4-pentenoate hydratase n=1 Tax=Streptomyces sp. NPDC058295 TaxID=3346431 RepID=UPI0036ED8C7B
MRDSPSAAVRTSGASWAGLKRERGTATESAATVAPRTLFDDGDLGSAYAVQQLNVRRGQAAGRRVVGRRIGLTSTAVQRQLGADRPDFGALFADMAVPDGGEVPAGRLLQPKVEAEVALVLVLGRDLPHRACKVVDVLRTVDFALPALEIVDSRVRGWDISLVDTVADNASCGLYVLGATPVPLAAADLRTVPMTRDGATVSEGTGADCLGSPLDAAVWLASALAERGDPLRAGDLVLTGALGPMTPAAPGDAFEAVIAGLGSVRVAFGREVTVSEEEDAR